MLPWRSPALDRRLVRARSVVIGPGPWTGAAVLSLGLSVLLPLCTLTGLSFPGRALLAVAYVLVVPGLAVADCLSLPSQLARWSLAVSLSLAGTILAAQGMLLVHWWHPLGAQLMLSATAVALVWLRAGRRVEAAG